ncbi:MAG: response regulator [Treponema sp.]|jgi:signal transduction histidine kinase|nr:response regulator [Treponema sp.]
MENKEADNPGTPGNIQNSEMDEKVSDIDDFYQNMTDELKKQRNLLKERLEQQELISEISRSFVSSGESQALINEAIAKLGNYHKVSRVIIFNMDYHGGNVNMMYQWSTDNHILRKGNFDIHAFAKSHFPEKLYDSSSMPFVSCSDTTKSTIDDARELIVDDVYAFISVPLYVEGFLWGVLVTEQCHTPRHWTDNEKRFVTMIASTIAAAIMLDVYNYELKDAITKVTATSKAKGDFLSVMSHEIRTPLNVILNMASIAKNAEDLERKDYALDKIINASKHLLGVINDILDMSKIEAHKYEIVPVKFNFEEMISRVVDIINSRVEEKQQKLLVKIDKNIPKNIVCDDQRLSQIITNLLGNAVKFTPENGTINLETQLLGEKNEVCTIQIAVTDTGIGISAEQQKNLFQSFQQAEANTTRKYGGTGLGLSISKSFVELMGGNIWVESEPGKGSTFAFTIQAQRCPLSESEETNEQTETEDPSVGSKDQKDTKINYSGHRILLVEDMEINRTIVLMLLEETEINIDCAENGVQAVEMYKENPGKYEMIFMDIHMPIMDGYEATRQIRLMEKEQNETSGQQNRIPIIAMTANVFKEDIDNCINAGMDGHLGKPLDINAFMEKLHTHLF